MFYKKLPNGKYRYYEKYYDENEGKWKQVSITLNSKSRQAQSQAKEILWGKIDSAQDNLFGVSEKITVSEILPEWLEIRRSELKESTYFSQSSIVNEFQNKFGTMRIKKVTNRMIQTFILSHESWSGEYKKLAKTVLNLFFAYCVKVGYINENPVQKVILPKTRKTLLEMKLKSEKFLDREEMKKYLHYLNENGSHPIYNKIVEVMYLTGMRSGEVLGLTWDVIDFESKTIEVKQTLQTRGRGKERYLSSPKTIAGYRQISISERVVEILRELKTESRSEFVFVTRNNTPYVLCGFNDYLKRMFEGSGIKRSENFRMTSHILRHSHISLLVEMNVPIRMIMDRVGHSDEKTTLQIYTHVTENMKEKLIEQLETLDV